jgi:quercetin dioxygenase-like cupin family protein
MQHFRLDEMTGGWFVGDFSPTVFETKDAEVAVKTYRAGDVEQEHFHKIATEITLIQSGTVRMLGREWSAGDIIVLAPGEATAFEAITDAVNVVVKVPSARDDKYLV